MTGYRRRSILIGTAVIAGSAGCIGQLQNDSDGGAEGSESGTCPQPSGPTTDDSGRFSEVGVESLEWDGTTLVIQFDPSFSEWDGWTIHHEYEDPESYRVVGGEYPRVDEPQRLPFGQLLGETLQDTYSTTTFEITTFDGMADPWDTEYGSGVVLVYEFGNSVSFEAPEHVLEEAGVLPES